MHPFPGVSPSFDRVRGFHGEANQSRDRTTIIVVIAMSIPLSVLSSYGSMLSTHYR